MKPSMEGEKVGAESESPARATPEGPGSARRKRGAAAEPSEDAVQKSVVKKTKHEEHFPPLPSSKSRGAHRRLG